MVNQQFLEIMSSQACHEKNLEESKMSDRDSIEKKKKIQIEKGNKNPNRKGK